MPSRPANASILRARQTSYGCLYRVYIESSVPGKQVASTESDYIDDPSRPLKRFSAPPSRIDYQEGRENQEGFSQLLP